MDQSLGGNHHSRLCRPTGGREINTGKSHVGPCCWLTFSFLSLIKTTNNPPFLTSVAGLLGFSFTLLCEVFSSTKNVRFLSLLLLWPVTWFSTHKFVAIPKQSRSKCTNSCQLEQRNLRCLWMLDEEEWCGWNETFRHCLLLSAWLSVASLACGAMQHTNVAVPWTANTLLQVNVRLTLQSDLCRICCAVCGCMRNSEFWSGFVRHSIGAWRRAICVCRSVSNASMLHLHALTVDQRRVAKPAHHMWITRWPAGVFKIGASLGHCDLLHVLHVTSVIQTNILQA